MNKLITIQDVVDAALAMMALINRAFMPGTWSRLGFGRLAYLPTCPDSGHPILFELLFSPPMGHSRSRRPIEFPHGEANVTAIISYGDGRQGWSVGPDGTPGDVMAALMGYKAVLDREDRGGNIKDDCHPLLIQAQVNRDPVELPCYGCQPQGSDADFDCPYCEGKGTLLMEWYYGMEGKTFALRKDIMGRSWNGHDADPEFTEVPMKKGSLVKVVMCSRFGDVGITPDLDCERGYIARVDPAVDLKPAEEKLSFVAQENAAMCQEQQAFRLLDKKASR